MRVVLVLFTLVIVCLAMSGDVQAYKDPFESWLPKEEISLNTDDESIEEAPVELDVHIEGILWGTDNPMTIVNGDIYKVGDTLNFVDAKVYKIEKNKVYLSYKEQVFIKGTSKEEEK